MQEITNSKLYAMIKALKNEINVIKYEKSEICMKWEQNYDLLSEKFNEKCEKFNEKCNVLNLFVRNLCDSNDDIIQLNECIENKLNNLVAKNEQMDCDIVSLGTEIDRLRNARDASADVMESHSENIHKLTNEIKQLKLKILEIQRCALDSDDKLNKLIMDFNQLQSTIINNVTNVNDTYGNETNSNPMEYHREELRKAYNMQPYQNFARYFDSDAYETLLIKLSLDRPIGKTDYINHIEVKVFNNDGLDISVDEVISLILIKFNNVFVDICKFEDIIPKEKHMNNGIITKIDFYVAFLQPVNHICLLEFKTKPLVELSINSIEFENLMNFGLLRFQEGELC